MTNPPPGWHPDPHDPRLTRWWDGHQWTNTTRPAGGVAPAIAPGPTPPNPAEIPPSPRPNWKRRAVKIGATIAGVYLVAVACNALVFGGSEDTSSTAATTTTTTSRAASTPAPRTTAPPKLTADDRDYLAQITDPAVRAGNNDADLLYLAESICLAADGGSTNAEITEPLLTAGFKLSQATEIVTAARLTYCPRE